jgi:hypothetical protein
MRVLFRFGTPQMCFLSRILALSRFEEAIQWVIVGDSGTRMKNLLKPVDNCISCKEEISNRDPVLMIEDFWRVWPR